MRRGLQHARRLAAYGDPAHLPVALRAPVPHQRYCHHRVAAAWRSYRCGRRAVAHARACSAVGPEVCSRPYSPLEFDSAMSSRILSGLLTKLPELLQVALNVLSVDVGHSSVKAVGMCA